MQPALAEQQPGEEEQRDRGETQPGRDVGEEGEQQQDDAELEEEDIHVAGGLTDEDTADAVDARRRTDDHQRVSAEQHLAGAG